MQGGMSIDGSANGRVFHAGTAGPKAGKPLSVEGIKTCLCRVEEHQARNKLRPVIDGFRWFDEFDNFSRFVPLVVPDFELVRYVDAQHFR